MAPTLRLMQLLLSATTCASFHEVRIPMRPGHLGDRPEQPIGDFLLKVLLGAVVGEADVGQLPRREKLLALRVRTGQLLPFQVEKLIE